jgi:amino-acid N-acetyltransferase
MGKNNTAGIEFNQADPEDIDAIRRLLRACDLPSADFEEHLPYFIVAKEKGLVIGTVGLEHSGSSAVIRSLAVEANQRGRGIGKKLTQHIIKVAQGLNVGELGLLTTTAEGFFSAEGFQQVKGTEIPAFIQATKEYQIYCPSSAVCMTRTLR